ncbi:MAG: phosphoribosylglycinamide formyltransferase [Thermoplasmata archaeon]
MARILPIAVLVSGEGTTLDALAEMAAGGHLPVRIVLVVADRPHAPAIERARRRGLATIVLPSHGVDPAAWSRRLTAELESGGAELVLNAGFLTILPDDWVKHWYGRAINLHPSLLPRHGGRGMYGARVHRAVLASGDRETGATVHLVTSDIDAGPTIAQERLPVLPGDTPETLRARLHPVEVELLTATLRRFADGSLPLPYADSDGPPPERRRDGADVRR